MIYYQYMLKKVHPTLNEYKVCWCNGKVDNGMVITLDGIPGRWMVVKMYHTPITHDVLVLNRNPNWYSI